MRISRSGAALTIHLITAGTLVACSAGEPTVTLQSESDPVTLDVSPPELVFGSLGQSRQLEVVVKDASGRRLAGVPVGFSSDHSGVATVSPAGLVTAVGNGDAQIAVRGGPLMALVPVRVRQIPAVLAKFGGDGQESTPAARLLLPLSVRVTDSLGVPVAGAAVSFAVAPGGGVVDPDRALTSPDGTASTAWTVGSAAGVQLVTARIDAIALPAVVFRATVRPDVPAQMSRTSPDSQIAVVGAAVAARPTVRVTDSYGNPVTGVTVTFSVVAGGGTVGGAVQTTDSSGLAAPGTWTLGTVPGVNTLVASAAGLPPVDFTAVASVGAPASLRVQSGEGQRGTIGAPLPVAPAVLVTDRYGNPAPAVAVYFTVVEGGGSVSGSPASTDQSGVARLQQWRLGPLPGINRVRATAADLPAVEFTALAIAPPAQVVVYAGDGQVAAAGTAVPVAPSVRVVDAFGNGVTGVPVSFSVGAGGGVVSGADRVTDSQGIASVGSWVLGTVVGPNTLHAVVSGLPAATFSATAIAGPPATLAAAAPLDQSAPAGSAVPVPPAVVVRDVHGNPVSGVSVTFAVVSGGGTVSPTSAATDAQGRATAVSWTLGTSAGANTLSATAAGNGITGNPVIFSATGLATEGFDIGIRFIGAVEPTQSQRSAFDDAVSRLRSIVTGDLPSVFVTLPGGSCGSNAPAIAETVDDVLVLVTLEPIDGPGGVLGSAGPCVIRSAGGLPLVGRMRFDTADLTWLEGDGRLGQVILHEVLHVLGVGTLWQLQGWLVNPSYPSSPGADTHMNGPNAVAGFDAIGGVTYSGGSKVPVHNSAVPGQADAHWRESVLLTELMTPFLNSGFNALSRLTVSSLRDLGYSVDLARADAFAIAPTLMAGEGPARPPLELVRDVDNLPLLVMDSRGTILRVIRLDER